MVVLSSGAGGRPGQSDFEQDCLGQQDGPGQAAFHQAAFHQVALQPGALGRMAAAASVGLCFLGGMATPADAGHHRHRTDAGKETSKPEPPKQPSGPLLLAVSISSQKVTVYDNGTPIATSSVSTGMSGHPTPTGIFSVIQKQRWHHSNLYSNAPMPYMQRITWSGVALHLGVVPGYPASHGCIRLPAGFATRLWGMTRIGARVIITRGDSGVPYEINHPRLAGLVQPPEADTPDAAPSDGAKPEPKPETKPEARPEGAGMSSPGAVVVATNGAVTSDTGHSETEHAPAPPQAAAGDPAAAAPDAPPAPPPPPKGEDVLQRPGQLSLFVSRREGKLFVRKGFTPAFDMPVKIAQPEKPLGTHLFTASRPVNDGAGLRWLGVSFSDRSAAAGGSSSHGKRKGRAERERPAPVTADSLRQSAVDALDRIELPAEALVRLSQLVAPGTSLVVSDQGLGGETGKETDFIVVTK